MSRDAVNVPVGKLEDMFRRTYRDQDPHRRAAVELLIRHDRWLYVERFRSVAVRVDGADGSAWIDWAAVRSVLEAGEFNYKSSTERAILDLALTLASDRYRLSSMGDATAALVLGAVQMALGQPWEAPARLPGR